jgi:hypothetical protein
VAGFGQWLMQRRVPRILLIAALFPAGLFGLVSAGAVVLTAELRGWQLAFQDVTAAMVLLVGVSLVAGGEPLAVVLSASLSWGLALALGSLTGAYGSLVLPVQLLLVAGIAGVLLFHVSVGDTTAFWEQSLARFAEELAAMGVEIGQPDALAVLAPTMTGAVAASAVLASLLALVLGAWWAGAAGGPRFGEMFIELRLGRIVGVLTAVLGILSFAGLGSLPADLLLVVAMGFAAQGLAVVHWQARARDWPKALLVLVYLPLLLGPSVFALGWFAVAALGFVDNWYPLRRRAGM